MDLELFGVSRWVTYGFAVSEATNSEGMVRDLPPGKYLQAVLDMLTVVLPQGHEAGWEICECLSLLLSLSLSVALWSRIQ